QSRRPAEAGCSRNGGGADRLRQEGARQREGAEIRRFRRAIAAQRRGQGQQEDAARQILAKRRSEDLRSIAPSVQPSPQLDKPRGSGIVGAWTRYLRSTREQQARAPWRSAATARRSPWRNRNSPSTIRATAGSSTIPRRSGRKRSR